MSIMASKKDAVLEMRRLGFQLQDVRRQIRELDMVVGILDTDAWREEDLRLAEGPF